MDSLLPITTEIKVDAGAACGRSHMSCSLNIIALDKTPFTLRFPFKALLPRAQRPFKEPEVGQGDNSPLSVNDLLSRHRIRHLFFVSSDSLEARRESHSRGGNLLLFWPDDKRIRPWLCHFWVSTTQRGVIRSDVLTYPEEETRFLFLWLKSINTSLKVEKMVVWHEKPVCSNTPPASVCNTANVIQMYLNVLRWPTD